MIAILDALKVLLSDAEFAAHIIAAPEDATIPYVLLWSTPGQPGIEPAVSGPGGISDLLGVTMVHTTPRNVLVMAARVRAVLDAVEVDAGGNRAWLSLATSEAVQPDRDVTLPSTNQHPFYAVDRYRLVATPIA